MVTAEIDKADQQRLTIAFGKLSALTGKPVQDLLKQHGRLFAVDAARFTGRFGNKPIDGKMHKSDVRSTILSTYIRPLAVAKIISIKSGERAGRKFSNYIRRRDIAKAQIMVDKICPEVDGYRIKVGFWDDGRMHYRRLKGDYKQRLCVMDYRGVTQYLKDKVQEVGELKAGWARAAEQLGGTRGIPAYAKKPHHKTKGKGEVRGRNSKSGLIVANYSDYIFKNTSLNRLWKLRAKKIEKTVEDTINRKSKRIAEKV